MKILWLYSYHHLYNFDHWLHADFAESIGKQVDIKFYGPRLHERYSGKIVRVYNSRTTLKDIHAEFPFDVILLCTKSRMFEYYNPFNDTARGCWIPSDFKTFPCLKVMLEEDYHYEKNDLWYRDIGINYLMQRHCTNTEYQRTHGTIPTIWFPFGVNTTAFKPNPKIKKIEKIAFAGSATNTTYPLRIEAVKRLKAYNLCHDYGTRAKEELYIQCLQSYVAHLSCGSIFNITPAKVFEIMASGSVLLTNDNPKCGLERLFGEGSFVTYDGHLKNLVDKANFIIYNKIERQKIVEKALEEIYSKHTNEIRVKQLIDILTESLANNNKLMRTEIF